MGMRTDLAAESCQRMTGNLPEGIRTHEEEFGALHIGTVIIEQENAAEMLGKAMGRYTTITGPSFCGAHRMTEGEIERIAEEIRRMLPPKGAVLVVGLGNNDITPDAVGARTAHQVLATRHISTDAARKMGAPSLRECAVIAPGVMGQTGIETSEIARALGRDIRPAAVIVVDALAAGSISRLGNTIQLSDSGIAPGSGVMNRRKELSEKTLGVPVVSIGVPTVVDAHTLAGDLLQQHDRAAEKHLLEPQGGSMMITPREVDVIISHASRVLAWAINKALHPGLSVGELAYLSG
jgi:Germination protease.